MNEPEDDPMRVSLLITCVVDVVAPEVGEAVVRSLRAAGCTVSCDLAQTCCGRPAWDAGFADEAAAVARPTLAALEAELDRGAAAVVVPSGSCAAMVRRSWPEMFEIAGDVDAARRARRVGERTHEWSELMVARGADHLPGLRLHEPLRVVLHRSCHRDHDPGGADAPAEVLARVAGCEAVAWTGADRCCGFGAPEAAAELSDEKLRALLGIDVVVGSDTACLLHLRARADALGTPVEVRHVAQVLHDALPGPLAEVAP
jgi:L-lactate dehydrogenase complex protein LldE